MLHQVDIRETRLTDLPAIYSLELSLFGEEAYPLFVLRQFFDISPRLMKVAEAEGSLVGYIMGNRMAEQSVGWVLSIGVRLGMQGKEIGQNLLSALLQDFALMGVKQAYLTVHPENAPALHLYRKFGFEQEREEEDYFFSGSPRILLVRQSQ